MRRLNVRNFLILGLFVSIWGVPADGLTQTAASARKGNGEGEPVTLTISEGSGKRVKPIFSSSFSNLEKICRVETTPDMGSRIEALGLSILGYTVGSDVQWYHLFNEQGEDGYGFNAWPRELAARNRTVEEAYGGALLPRKDSQGTSYSYWIDFLHTLRLVKSDFLMCPNIYSARLAYDGTTESLEDFWRDFDKMVSDVTAAGSTTPIVQLGTESQLYRDLFPQGVGDYSKICEALIPGIRKRLPGTLISVDGSNFRNPEWDKAVASIPGIDAMRVYLQIMGRPQDDYPGMRLRANVDLPGIVDDFMTSFPGKKIVLLQMAVKNRHRYHHRIAHGLYLAELFVRLAQLNLENNDVIAVASQMNLRHLFSSDLTPMPPYFGMLAVKGIWGGIAQESHSNSAGLVTFAVKKEDGQHVVVVINPTEAPVRIDQVVVNGKVRTDYEVNGYHGELNSTAVSTFDSLSMPRFSWATVSVP